MVCLRLITLGLCLVNIEHALAGVWLQNPPPEVSVCEGSEIFLNWIYDESACPEVTAVHVYYRPATDPDTTIDLLQMSSQKILLVSGEGEQTTNAGFRINNLTMNNSGTYKSEMFCSDPRKSVWGKSALVINQDCSPDAYTNPPIRIYYPDGIPYPYNSSDDNYVVNGTKLRFEVDVPTALKPPARCRFTVNNNTLDSLGSCTTDVELSSLKAGETDVTVTLIHDVMRDSTTSLSFFLVPAPESGEISEPDNRIRVYRKTEPSKVGAKEIALAIIFLAAILIIYGIYLVM